MFERFTEQARRVLFFARYEASQLGTPSIETEHLLLGLIREGKGLTSRIFARSHLSLESIRKEIEERTVVREMFSTSVEIPFSAETMNVLQLATEEADGLLHREVGAEHLLLGILRVERSVAGTILIDKGMRLGSVREQIVTLENASSPTEHDELTRLTEENAGLRFVIQELQHGDALPLQFRKNAYWLHRTGQAPEGPYCSTCWDIERRLVRKLRADGGDLYCDYCTHYRRKH